VADHVRAKFTERGVKFVTRTGRVVTMKRNGAKPKPKM
jgi:hypothetical protein